MSYRSEALDEMILEMLEDPIVVTGVGCVSPSGNNVPDAMDSIFSGKDGIGLMPPHVNEGFLNLGISVAAQVKGLEKMSDPLVKPFILRQGHRSAEFALRACAEAGRQANLFNAVPPKGMSPLQFHGAVDPDRVGMSIGTGFGGGDLVAEAYEKLKTEQNVDIKRSMGSMVLRALPERIFSMPSMVFGARGPIGGVTAACATGNANIVEAARKLRLREADVVIAGGADAQINTTGIGFFAGLGALDKNTDPNLASRPFHADEAGFVMGEGAAVLVLERLSHARARGATVLAKLVGYGESADASSNTSPSGEGAVRAIRQALRGVEIGPNQAYVNAHGTGTGGDKKELAAILECLGLDKLAAVSSTKGATGHMMGAAGAMESIISIEALRRKKAPPTLKLTDMVEIARGLPTSPLYAMDIRDVLIAINNSFGFGGINSVTAWSL